MTTKLLKDAGEVLYGHRWQSDLARDLQMSDRHMRRLISGTADLNPGMAMDIWRLCEERAALIDEVIKRLKSASAP
jgi:methylphosphotriester-DNA--protein-cysteine methyltransferase